MKPECRAAVSMQRRTSASICCLGRLLEHRRVDVADGHRAALGDLHEPLELVDVQGSGSACWSRSKEMVVKPQPIRSS